MRVSTPEMMGSADGGAVTLSLYDGGGVLADNPLGVGAGSSDRDIL